MASFIHRMTVIRYYRDGRDWDTEEIVSPAWSDVSGAWTTTATLLSS